MSIFNFFKKKSTPIVIQDALGTFTLDDPKIENSFVGDIDWLGKEIVCELFCDADGALTANKAQEYLHQLMNSCEEWDREIKRFAADKVAQPDELIKIWCSADDGKVLVTPEEFIRRIDLEYVALFPDGKLFFSYDPDEMFTDHGLTIEANISGAITDWGLDG